MEQQQQMCVQLAEALGVTRRPDQTHWKFSELIAMATKQSRDWSALCEAIDSLAERCELQGDHFEVLEEARRRVATAASEKEQLREFLRIEIALRDKAVADRDRLAAHVDLLLTLLAEERQRRLPGQANGARGASSP